MPVPGQRPPDAIALQLFAAARPSTPLDEVGASARRSAAVGLPWAKD